MLVHQPISVQNLGNSPTVNSSVSTSYPSHYTSYYTAVRPAIHFIQIQEVHVELVHSSV